MQPSNSPAVQRHLHVTVVPVVTAGSEVQSGRDSNPDDSGLGGVSPIVQASPKSITLLTLEFTFK